MYGPIFIDAMRNLERNALSARPEAPVVEDRERALSAVTMSSSRRFASDLLHRFADLLDPAIDVPGGTIAGESGC